MTTDLNEPEVDLSHLLPRVEVPGDGLARLLALHTRRRRRRRLLTAGAMGGLAAVLTAVGLTVALPDHTQPTQISTATTPSNPSPRPQVRPVVIPPGWRTVVYRDAAISVPPSWQVHPESERVNGCALGTLTESSLILGSLQAGKCGVRVPEFVDWVVIEPLVPPATRGKTPMTLGAEKALPLGPDRYTVPSLGISISVHRALRGSVDAVLATLRPASGVVPTPTTTLVPPPTTATSPPRRVGNWSTPFPLLASDSSTGPTATPSPA